MRTAYFLFTMISCAVLMHGVGYADPSSANLCTTAFRESQHDNQRSSARRRARSSAWFKPAYRDCTRGISQEQNSQQSHSAGSSAKLRFTHRGITHECAQ